MEETLMTMYRSVLRTILLLALVACLITSPAWATPNEGALVGWGNNGNGQTTVPAGNNFVAIAAGYTHSLALKSDGSLAGWGDNSFGQTNVPAGNDFVAIAAGDFESLALKSDGSLVGWGNNGSGQTTVPAGNNFMAIAAGFFHGLALKSDGSLVGWGDNSYGQLYVPADDDFVAIAAGGTHSLALKSDGSMAGWGSNYDGQSNVPTGNDYVAVSAGGAHSLALKSDGSLAGWGNNSLAQATVPVGNDFVVIATGVLHSLAIQQVVPEPASIVLIVLGSIAIGIRRNRRITKLPCLICALSITAAAQAAPYTVTDMGALGGTDSMALAMNNHGQVTGYAATTDDLSIEGFLWTPTTPNSPSGSMLGLESLNGIGSWATGINSSGQVAGVSFEDDDDGDEHATLWIPTTPNGTSGSLHDLGTLGGTYSEAHGINDFGQVSGAADVTGDSATHAFMWKPTTPNSATGTMYDLGSLGGSFTIGWDVNASGTVTGGSDMPDDAGAHAFLWKPTTSNGTSGTMHDLGTLGGTVSDAHGINDSGQVTGYSQTTGDAAYHAFLWTPTTPGGSSGTMLDLGTRGALNSYGYDVNSSGQVIGLSEVAPEVSDFYHAFLYTSATGMVDLNTLIDPLSGWEITNPSDINDAGQITGQGLINGEYHAFLLTPVQFPGDFNNDGTVDAADYTVWRDNLGAPAGTLPNDPAGGAIGTAQYAQWKSHFGQTGGAGSGGSWRVAVPEPATLMLLFAAACWCLRRGRAA